MKKQLKVTGQLLVLLLLPAMVINSCGKIPDSSPEENQQTVQTMLKGSWKEISGKYEYFDSNGTKIYEESVDETVDQGIMSFDGSAGISVKVGASIDKGTYVLSKEGSVNFLTLTNSLGSAKYNIITLTKTNMSLGKETLEDIYYIGTTLKHAAKSILTSNLVKN